jgi:ABC-type bacteriocin/lantibiotic exporter with double-glycine peptidase domain
MTRLILVIFRLYPKLCVFVIGLILFSILLDLILPLITIFFIDKVIIAKNLSLLNTIGIILFSFFVLKIFSDFFNQYSNMLLKEKVSIHFIETTFKNLLDSEYLSIINESAGYWTNRVLNEPQQIAQLFKTVIDIFTSLITLTVGLFFILHFSLSLGLLVILIIPLYTYSLFVMGPKIRKSSIKLKEQRSKVNGFIDESILGVELLKLYPNNRFLELRNLLNENLRLNIKLFMIYSINNILASSIASIAPIIVLWYGGYLAIIGTLTLGTVIGINKFLSYVFRPITTLININSTVQDSMASLQRYEEIIKMQKENNQGKNIIVHSEDTIKISNLSYKYGANQLFHDLNMDIPGGKTTAIIGNSGCGKSTILKLIIGLLRLDAGNIYIGNNSLVDMDLSIVRKNIFLISQTEFLFSNTMDYNITMGDDTLTINQELLRISGIDKFINNETKLSNYHLGCNGMKLSGGQRQRVALARALIQEPKILLMDEVTSEIDAETEKEIIDNIISTRKNKTTVIVSHNISSVKNADQIIMISEGNALETGSHDKLIKSSINYQKLWTIHNGKEYKKIENIA